MSSSANAPKRRLLLASDRTDSSSELATILQSVGEVQTVATSEIPDKPGQVAGVIVDINLRSPESVQMVRNKLRAEAYREMPRLFVLADALHHGSMQGWADRPTGTNARPFSAEGILPRTRLAAGLAGRRARHHRPAVRRARRTAGYPGGVSGRRFRQREGSRQGGEPL